MFNNNLYNLMMQATVEHLSLWRIKKHYIREAKDKENKKFWADLVKEKEANIKKLKVLIKKELK